MHLCHLYFIYDEQTYTCYLPFIPAVGSILDTPAGLYKGSGGEFRVTNVTHKMYVFEGQQQKHAHEITGYRKWDLRTFIELDALVKTH